MNYLSVDSLSKSYGEKVLFNDISFGLDRGDKVALVANNGSGKSTLLNIICSKDYADSGTVTFRSGISISMLTQQHDFDIESTIDEVIGTCNLNSQKIKESYASAVKENSISNTNETKLKLEEAIALMDTYDVWDFERRLRELLNRFNITDTSLKIKDYSGGQIKRISLALALVDEPDVLLLDEPTNHLDIDIIEWLEDYLLNSKTTLLMVTHDRYFLDRVCNKIIELTDGEIYYHLGNYTYFLEKRAERIANNRVEVEKAQKLMKKELDWIRRMPKARTTKSKARIDSFYKTKEKATSLKKEQELRLSIQTKRIGGKILEMNNVVFGYDNNPLLSNFSYIFKKGERIGFVGNNGAGKTTFLDLIMGLKHPQRGNIITGDTVVFGYYQQEGINIKENQTVLQVVKDIAEVIPVAKGVSYTASQFLNHFMFPPIVQNDYVSNLSGGEKRRLYLLTVLINNPNFLILDEPTNDLDLLTLNKLEEFLENYQGCLILVSHDRSFLDKLVDHIFVFEGNGKIKDYHSNYSEYREIRDKQTMLEKKVLSKSKKTKAVDTKEKIKTKLTYAEKIEYEKLLAEIEELESEKNEIETILNSGIDDYQAIQNYSQRLGVIIKLIDDKTLRWMELDEYV